VGFLRTSFHQVKSGAAPDRPIAAFARLRLWCLIGAVILGIAGFLPPLWPLAHRYELGQVLRYGLWALLVPALVVVGAPWQRASWAAMLADRRRRRPEVWRAVGFVLVDALVMIWWFTPPSVGATRGHPVLTVLEAVTLIAAGIGLWLELIPSPPCMARSGGLRRAVLAAVVMWLIWVEAYLVAMSGPAWYRGFSYRAGQGLSLAADQQVAAVILWLIATVVFVPVIFVSAMQWLHGEPDADGELRRVVREQRRGATAIMERRSAGA
jgi:cytochrome c oxidase assembly factor CtaG